MSPFCPGAGPRQGEGKLYSMFFSKISSQVYKCVLKHWTNCTALAGEGTHPFTPGDAALWSVRQFSSNLTAAVASGVV